MIAALEVQAGFRASVETDDDVIPVFLARFTSIDPPFEIAARLDAEFIHLIQARDLDRLELDVLRRAYEIIMGG